jgi:hypothetical protein
MQLYVLLNSLDEKYGGVTGITNQLGKAIDFGPPIPMYTAMFDYVHITDVNQAVAFQKDRRPLADKLFGTTSAALVVSSKACEIIQTLNCAEFRKIPVSVTTKRGVCVTYYLLHFRERYDALNGAESEFNFFKPVPEIDTEPRIQSIRRFVFDPTRTPDLDLFEMGYAIDSAFVVSDRFVTTVSENRLTGFRMLPVWCSGESSEKPIWYYQFGWKCNAKE